MGSVSNSVVRAHVESNAVCDEESLLVVNTRDSRTLRAYADSSPWGATWTGLNCGNGGQQLGGGESKHLRYEQCFNLCICTPMVAAALSPDLVWTTWIATSCPHAGLNLVRMQAIGLPL